MPQTSSLPPPHILKLLLTPKKAPARGLKCYPQQTYGTSQEAPAQFRTSAGLTAGNGYMYQEEQDRDNKEELVVPLSQRKYCSVVGATIDVVDSFRDKYEQERGGRAFHRRKGRLGEYVDRNGWMRDVVPLMGYERSAEGRELANREREKCIKSARKYNQYTNPVQKRRSASKQGQLNSGLFTQKAKIRLQRLTLSTCKQKELQVQKSIAVSANKNPEADVYIDAESLTNQMAGHSREKQWRSTMTSMRKKFRIEKPDSDRLNLTRSDWRRNNQTIQVESARAPTRAKDELVEWFNTTCNSGADRWRYRKPQKQATASDQQILS